MGESEEDFAMLEREECGKTVDGALECSSGTKNTLRATDNAQGSTGGQATSGTLCREQGEGGTDSPQQTAAARGTQSGDCVLDSNVSVAGGDTTHGSAIQQQTRGTRTGVPLWQKISGLTSEAERKMSRSERRFAIRKLFKDYERRVREALQEHENDAEKEERSFLWEPIAEICFELGIARRKLSALTKELTGMAAHEVVDKIRAEKLKEKLDEKLTGVVGSYLSPGEKYFKYADLADALKSSRQRLSYDSAHWATQFGFANYARYRRGCMLAHGGLTPRQVEGRILHEFHKYYWLCGEVRSRQKMCSRDYWVTRIEVAGTPYQDEWAQAKKEQPEWLKKMRERFGILEELIDFAEMDNHPPLDEEEVRIKQRVEESKREEAEREQKQAEANAKKQAEFEELARKKNKPNG